MSSLNGTTGSWPGIGSGLADSAFPATENAPNAGHGRGHQTTSGNGQHPDDDKAAHSVPDTSRYGQRPISRVAQIINSLIDPGAASLS